MNSILVSIFIYIFIIIFLLIVIKINQYGPLIFASKKEKEFIKHKIKYPHIFFIN